MATNSWLMVHGSWFMAQGSWLMAHGQAGWPGPGARERAGPGPGPGSPLGPLAVSHEPRTLSHEL